MSREGKRGWKRLGSIAIRVLISAALVSYLLYRIEFDQLLKQLAGVQWTWLLGALAIYLASQLVSSQRWHAVAVGMGLPATRLQFLKWYFEGMFFSLCLPTSIGGDVVKAYRLGRPPGAPKQASRLFLAGCTVLADRLAGLLALVCLGLAALAQHKLDISPVGTIALGALLLVGVAASFQLGGPLLGLLRRMTAGSDKLLSLVHKLAPLGQTPGVLRWALAASVGVQLLNIMVVWAIGHAMELEVPLRGYFLSVAVVAVATTLPISINGVGVREGGFAVMLAPFGVSEASAVALGLLWFLVTLIGGILSGAAWLFEPEGFGVSLEQQLESERQAELETFGKDGEP